MRKINIGILGYGVVASGVKNLLDENQAIISKRLKQFLGRDYTINIRRILIRDIEKYDRNLQKLMTEDIKDIVQDEEIDIVCELIGGDRVAFDYMKKALDHKKHLVTANKMAIFNKSQELFQAAERNKRQFKYEGAVAGAIPIIKIAQEVLLTDQVEEVVGIFNGSTNYILSKIDEGLDFNEAMDLAREKGYLEADPSSDIEGYDSMYKLGILGSLIYGEFPQEEDIERIGIDTIKEDEIKAAKDKANKIKLLGRIENNNGRLAYSVRPQLVDGDSPLYEVDGSLNGIFLKCKNAGDLFLSGPGAGSRETAVSVVSDIISIIREEY